MNQPFSPQENHTSLINVLAALGDPVRLKIVTTLVREGERSSTDFDCSIASSTLSHHIRKLRDAGLVVHRKEGTRCFVSQHPDIEQKFPGLVEYILRFVK